MASSQLDDTSGGRTSSHRSPAPVHPSRSHLRQSGVVSDRTGISASRLQYIGHGPLPTNSPSISTARSDHSATLLRTAVADGSSPRHLPVSNMSPTAATARLLSPNATPGRRVALTPAEVRAIIAGMTPQHTAATQNSASPYSTPRPGSEIDLDAALKKAGRRSITASARRRGTSSTRRSSTSSSNGSKSRKNVIIDAQEGNHFSRQRPIFTPDPSTATGSASNASCDQNAIPMESPYFKKEPAIVSRVSLTTPPPVVVDNVTGYSSGHPTAHIISDTDTVGRIDGNRSRASRTPASNKSASRASTSKAASLKRTPRPEAPTSSAGRSSAKRGSKPKAKKPKSLFCHTNDSKSSASDAARQRASQKKAMKKRVAQTLSNSGSTSARKSKKQMVAVGTDPSGLVRVRVRVQLVNKSANNPPLNTNVSAMNTTRVPSI